jgi:hypothetical protein
MAALSNLPLRGFAAVRRDLEETAARLGKTFNPEVRVKLLREFRLLLQEADSLIRLPE